MSSATIVSDGITSETMNAESASRESSEKALMLTALNSQRDHVLGILDGLSDEALRRPVLPTGWSCLALVRHLTVDVEQLWFRVVAAGERIRAGRGRLAGRPGRARPGGPRRLPPGDRAGQRGHRGHPDRRPAWRSGPRSSSATGGCTTCAS